MNFLAEKDLDRGKYGDNLFILAYDAARNKRGRSIAEKFKIDAGTSLESVRAQFHDVLSLPFITDEMLDMIRERLNEEAERNRGTSRQMTAAPTKIRFHLVPIDYVLLAIVFIVTYTLGKSLIDALMMTGFATILYGVTNMGLDKMKNDGILVVETNTGEKTGATFSNLCSYGAELVEAHLRYTDSPERPLS